MKKKLIPIFFRYQFLFILIGFSSVRAHNSFLPGTALYNGHKLSTNTCLRDTFYDAPTSEQPYLTFDLIFPQAVQTNPHTIYIPFRLVGRLIAVDARVDTNAGIFFLDTGAERLLLNSNYFRSGLGDRKVASTGTTGMVESVFYKKVDTLYWDELHFPNQQANVLDLSHIERKKNIRLIGIIGYEVLKDFEVFLDYQLMRIVLSRLDRDGFRMDAAAIWEEPYDSLDFKLARHLIVLNAEVQGVNLRLALDTGAELNLLDRLVRKKVLENFEIIKRVNMIGAGQNTIEVLAGTLFRVQAGNQKCSGMRTLLTNLDDMGENAGIRLDGFLGYEFLYTRRTVINYKRKKLFFFNQHRP